MLAKLNVRKSASTKPVAASSSPSVNSLLAEESRLRAAFVFLGLPVPVSVRGLPCNALLWHDGSDSASV